MGQLSDKKNAILQSTSERQLLNLYNELRNRYGAYQLSFEMFCNSKMYDRLGLSVDDITLDRFLECVADVVDLDVLSTKPLRYVDTELQLYRMWDLNLIDEEDYIKGLVSLGVCKLDDILLGQFSPMKPVDLEYVLYGLVFRQCFTASAKAIRHYFGGDGNLDRFAEMSSILNYGIPLGDIVEINNQHKGKLFTDESLATLINHGYIQIRIQDMNPLTMQVRQTIYDTYGFSRYLHLLRIDDFDEFAKYYQRVFDFEKDITEIFINGMNLFNITLRSELKDVENLDNVNIEKLSMRLPDVEVDDILNAAGVHIMNLDAKNYASIILDSQISADTICKKLICTTNELKAAFNNAHSDELIYTPINLATELNIPKIAESKIKRLQSMLSEALDLTSLKRVIKAIQLLNQLGVTNKIEHLDIDSYDNDMIISLIDCIASNPQVFTASTNLTNQLIKKYIDTNRPYEYGPLIASGVLTDEEIVNIYQDELLTQEYKNVIQLIPNNVLIEILMCRKQFDLLFDKSYNGYDWLIELLDDNVIAELEDAYDES